MLNGLGSVAVSVPRDSSHSESDDDVAARVVTSGNSDSEASIVSSPNNSEEPLPLELHSTPVPLQVIILHSVIVTYTNIDVYMYVHTV